MASKQQKAKSEAVSLSNKTIPLQLDRLVVMLSQNQYKGAIKEVESIKKQIKVLEENIKQLLIE